MLIANIVPEVWGPPVEVRELRGLVSYRQRVVKTGAMIRNRLHSLLHRHNLSLPEEGIAKQGMVGTARAEFTGKVPGAAGNRVVGSSRYTQSTSG